MDMTKSWNCCSFSMEMFRLGLDLGFSISLWLFVGLRATCDPFHLHVNFKKIKNNKKIKKLWSSHIHFHYFSYCGFAFRFGLYKSKTCFWDGFLFYHVLLDSVQLSIKTDIALAAPNFTDLGFGRELEEVGNG